MITVKRPNSFSSSRKWSKPSSSSHCPRRHVAASSSAGDGQFAEHEEQIARFEVAHPPAHQEVEQREIDDRRQARRERQPPVAPPQRVGEDAVEQRR